MEKRVLKKVPSNFKLIFSLAGKKYKCPGKILTWDEILRDEKVEPNDWF